ncbi:NmrA-like family protein [Franzmannia pantelleriensis]|uniref:NmrA-like family protein n=1 Tax=Franzmannia pantelleriensis TaxID=48727 RepID=A0A1G9P8R1_9GAMM|nr:aromatic alcohol reductase [Halomonas pantelleriensis]SDL95252.1 NmrA-like family protein [Halomonas pantelleriensis]
MAINETIQVDKILILGAGQLGMQVIINMTSRVSPGSVSVLVEPGFTTSSDKYKKEATDELNMRGVDIIPFDLSEGTETALAELFSNFQTIICCTGFIAGPGTQLKITHAALAAGVSRYFPWQFGVDYDIVGKGSGQPVFDEQYEVRQLLRSQEKTEWVIVSTGMFTSFLFEPSFGVVDFETNTIRALGSCDTRVTVTTPEDIGWLTTAIYLEEPRIANEVVLVAGDTISYGQLAAVVEEVTGKAFKRVQLSIAELNHQLAQTPDDVMLRYRAAFALGTGMWWEKSKTYNFQKGMETVDVKEWLLRHLSDVAPQA